MVKKRKTFTEQGADYYVFNLSSLGWINCDRFLNTKGKKYTFSVKNDCACQQNYNHTRENSLETDESSPGSKDRHHNHSRRPCLAGVRKEVIDANVPHQNHTQDTTGYFSFTLKIQIYE